MTDILYWLQKKSACGCSCSRRAGEAAQEIMQRREFMRITGAEANYGLWSMDIRPSPERNTDDAE